MKTNTVLAQPEVFDAQYATGKQLAIDAYVHWRSQGPEKHEMTAHMLAAGILESMKDSPYEEKEQLLAYVFSEMFEAIE